MVRFLPFILIPVLIIAGLGYWRFQAAKESSEPAAPSEETQDSSLTEVPKTLPGKNLEERVGDLEDEIAKLSSAQPSPGSTTAVPNLSSRLANAEAAINELKTRVAVLENASPTTTTTTSTNKYPLYIPLGSGGGPWGSQDWQTLNEYQVSINPDNYSGYSGMQLEVNFRLSEAAGTGSVRLYNVTDGSSVSSQLDTTSTNFATQSSGSFKLSSGQKTYTLQMKSSQGKDFFIQSARIKVSF